MFKTIVLASDGSRHASSALDRVVALANGGLVEAVHVVYVDPPVSPDVVGISDPYVATQQIYATTVATENKAGHALMAEATKKLRSAGVPEIQEHFRVGDPATQIVGLAGMVEADLIVMGRRGLGAVTGIVLGSVTRRVEHDAEIAVLTVV